MTKITKTYSIRKFITVYIAAVVVDLLVWFASSEAYRQRILAMGSSFRTKSKSMCLGVDIL